MSKTSKIVHEINNPLSVIKNYLKVLTLRTDDHSSARNELRIIDEEINRVSRLIKSLTSPSGSLPIDLEPVDVNATIADILGLFREGLPANTSIHLTQDLDARLPAIPSNRDRLKQALINLLKNAMEAVSDGGSIWVRTRLLNTVLATEDSPAYENTIRISVCAP